MISFFNPCTLKRTSGTRVLTHTYLLLYKKSDRKKQRKLFTSGGKKTS